MEEQRRAINQGSTPPPVEAITRNIISFFNRFSQANQGIFSEASGVHLNGTSSTTREDSNKSNVRVVENDKVKAYKEFIATMKMVGEEYPQVLQKVAEFLESISKRGIANKYPIFDDDDIPGCHEEFASEVHLFLQNQARELTGTRFWNGASETELILMREHLERLVMSKIHDHVFSPTEAHKERDEQLSVKINKILSMVDPVKNLDVRVSLYNPEEVFAWDRAGEELKKMNKFKTPREKVACVTNACRILVQHIKNCGETPIPDVFLPSLVYLVARANPDFLFSNVEYIAAYRGQEFMMDERGHFFLHFASSVSFLSRADAKSLSIDATVFENALQENEAVLTVPIAHSLIPSVEWFESRFQYENVEESELKVSEVPQLLSEYKLLVQFCRKFALQQD